MTTYDRGQVPILDFHNPAGAIIHHDGYAVFSHPMGNTRKRSVTEQIGTAKDQHLDLLLLGCGDIRNLLCTVSELSQRKTKHRPKSVDFHLNDYDALILPRDAILLEIASKINPDSTDDVDFLWNVWNNMCLSERHYQRLKQVIQSLQDRHFEDEGSMIQFQDSKTEQECRAVWRDWSQLDLDVNKVKQERNKFNTEYLSYANEQIHRHILTKIALAICSKNQDFLRESSIVHGEVTQWVLEGSTADAVDHINPTLMSPFLHEWKINYKGSPFEGYMPFDIPDIERCKSLTGVCKEILASWIKRFQQFKQTHPIKVILWSGDGLGLCTSGFPKDLLFDVMDTSNVSDHSGLLNVIVCCAPRLKRPRESMLLTSTMLWWGTGCRDMEDYYYKSIGVNRNILPTVLGVHLAVDFDLGNRKVPDDWEEVLYWVKAPTSRTKILELDACSDVINALWELTQRCFFLKEELDLDLSKEYSCGADLASPFTLLRIIYQLAPLIEGGASEILELLETEIPVVFYEDYCYSWELLKSIASQDNQPVVQVTVPVSFDLKTDKIEEIKRIRSTPMVVFFDSYIHDSLMEEKSSHIDIEGLSTLYNSIRFNMKEGKVTFHMLKNDWEREQRTSWLSLVQGREDPSLIYKPVCLKDDSLFEVKEIDPVQTFGLFAVQKFEVGESSTPHLQLAQMMEEEEFYYANLAYRDPKKYDHNDIKIQFVPESSPTQVNLKFGKEIGFILNLSSPIDASASTFHTCSNTNSIHCDLVKKEDHIAGEMAILNPAQVPFHAMTSWDPKEDDIEWTIEKMFRDNFDAGAKSSPAFGQVRRLIMTIFRKHLETQDHVLFNISDDSEDPSKSLIVKVFNRTYKLDHLPYVKCIFHDMQSVGLRVFEDFNRFLHLGAEFVDCDLYPLQIGEEEFDLIRRLLYINAARIEQDTKRTPDWTDSFLAPICARETNFNKVPTSNEDIARINILCDQLIGNGEPKYTLCAFCRKPPTDIKKCFECKKVVCFNDGDCLRGHWQQEHKDSYFFSSSGQPRKERGAEKKSSFFQEKEPELVDRCAYCRQTSQSLKKCTRCRKVSYCNSICQRKHWKNDHKSNCQPTPSERVLDQHDELQNTQLVSARSARQDRKEETPRCAFCQKSSSHLKKCTRCEKVFYCSKECQKRDWVKEHKDICNANPLDRTPSHVVEDAARRHSAPSSNLCDCCQKAWRNLQNCTKCKKATYSDKACQTGLW